MGESNKMIVCRSTTTKVKAARQSQLASNKRSRYKMCTLFNRKLFAKTYDGDYSCNAFETGLDPITTSPRDLHCRATTERIQSALLYQAGNYEILSPSPARAVSCLFVRFVVAETRTSRTRRFTEVLKTKTCY